MIPLSAALHHGEAGDPELLGWIMHRLDALISLDPATIVALLGLAVVAMPVAVLALYARHKRKALR